ncbi:uncharacterized protein [Pyrus communis]|uniref:uncharacterized protein n=1 Tax=Pyrus communis TaxID=23211 RepID=UPI0035BFAE72
MEKLLLALLSQRQDATPIWAMSGCLGLDGDLELWKRSIKQIRFRKKTPHLLPAMLSGRSIGNQSLQIRCLLATLEKRAHAPLKEITLVRTPGANSTSKHHNVIKQMKIVVKVPMHCDKCRTKALKIAAAAHGVSKVSIEGANKDHVEVIGDDVDSVCLTRSLRKKLGCSCTIIKVEEVKPADKPGKKPPDEPVKKPPPCPCPCPAPPPCPCPAPKPCPAPPPCPAPCPAPPPCPCPAPKPCPCPAPPPCPCPAPKPCPAPPPCSAPSPSCVQNCCATQFRPMYCEVVHEYPEPTTCSIM